MTWRQATREEIYAYYTEEFPGYIDDIPAFITADGPKQYAVAFRDPHPVRKDDIPDKDFIRRDTWQTDTFGERTIPEFSDFEDILEFIQHPARNDPLGWSEFALADPDLLEKSDPHPDAVYYALDHWHRPWVLLVDIDAKTIGRVPNSSRVVTDSCGNRVTSGIHPEVTHARHNRRASHG